APSPRPAASPALSVRTLASNCVLEAFALRPPLARTLFLGCTALAIQAAIQCARGHAPTLPETTVTPPKETPRAKPAPKQKAQAATQPQPQTAAPPTESAIATDTKAFNAARDNV